MRGIIKVEAYETELEGVLARKLKESENEVSELKNFSGILFGVVLALLGVIVYG